MFEWVTEDLGAQGTVCAGGRYDGLVGSVGRPPNTCRGLCHGVERLVLLLQTLNQVPEGISDDTDAVLIVLGISCLQPWRWLRPCAMRCLCCA